MLEAFFLSSATGALVGLLVALVALAFRILERRAKRRIIAANRPRDAIGDLTSWKRLRRIRERDAWEAVWDELVPFDVVLSPLSACRICGELRSDTSMLSHLRYAHRGR